MINISIYNGTTLTETYSAKQFEGLRYGTMYPGGLYSTCSFTIPGKLRQFRDISGNYAIVIRDGLRIVWLGKVDGVQLTGTGMMVQGVGDWGILLNRRTWNKPWCDTRIDNNTWYELPGTLYDANDISDKQAVDIDRLNRIRITPKAIQNTGGTATAWTDETYHRIRYSMPTGETVKRVTCTSVLAEGTQNWLLGMYQETSPAFIWSATTSGTVAQDVTLGTPSQHIFLMFQAKDPQIPATDGSIYGEVSNVKVYGETGNINLTEVAKDVRAKFTGLDTSENWIASNTLALEPFISNGYETPASILTRAAGYGDSSANPWACYLGDSETWAGDTFPLPMLVVEQQPVLTAADYYIRAEDIPGFAPEIDYSGIYNWIIVEYQDLTGKTTFITPDDDSSLKDTTSIATYGQREYKLTINTESSTTATNYGKRFLAAYKDPKIILPGPIVLKNLKSGWDKVDVRVAQVVAGRRIKISNFLQDITGSGMTFLISQTEYNHDDDTISITAGQPDPLAVMVARQAANLKW